PRRAWRRRWGWGRPSWGASVAGHSRGESAARQRACTLVAVPARALRRPNAMEQTLPPSTDRPGAWRPAAEMPGHPLADLDASEVGQGVRLVVEVGSESRGGARYFRAFLDSQDLGRTLEPLLVGLHHQGASPAQHWVEVTDFRGQVPVP